MDVVSDQEWTIQARPDTEPTAPGKWEVSVKQDGYAGWAIHSDLAAAKAKALLRLQVRLRHEGIFNE